MRITECKDIPSWLLDNLEINCNYCGEEFHVGYSPDGRRITKHYCPNPECPATIAKKIAYINGVLKIDGIKFKRALDLVKSHNIKRPLDALPYMLSYKPTVDISTFMRLTTIEGIENRWNSICSNVKNLDEVIDNAVKNNVRLYSNDIEYIKYASSLFIIKYPTENKYKSEIRYNIMITGDINGFANRDLFPAAINQKYKGFVEIGYYKNKRKTGVDFLVMEKNSAITGKVQVARENNIPIVTPGEFIYMIDKEVRERFDNYEF